MEVVLTLVCLTEWRDLQGCVAAVLFPVRAVVGGRWMEIVPVNGTETTLCVCFEF